MKSTMGKKADHLTPQAFFLEGGPLGALLIHGFTASPTEMRLVGEYLNERGNAFRPRWCHPEFTGHQSDRSPAPSSAHCPAFRTGPPETAGQLQGSRGIRPSPVLRRVPGCRIASDSARIIYDGPASVDKELLTLHGSGHALSLDSEPSGWPSTPTGPSGRSRLSAGERFTRSFAGPFAVAGCTMERDRLRTCVRRRKQ